MHFVCRDIIPDLKTKIPVTLVISISENIQFLQKFTLKSGAMEEETSNIASRQWKKFYNTISVNLNLI